MSNHASKNHGCFSSVLHRFLCGGGLPTHPSSDIDSPKKDSTPSPGTHNTNTNTNTNTNMTSTSSTPVGIVARLMGLDSIPNSPILMQKSRSLGSLDHFLPSFHIHRRVVSFREHDLGKYDMGLTPTQQKFNNNNNMKIKKMKNVNNTTMKKQRYGVKVKKEKEEVCTTSVPLKMRRKKVVVDDGFPDARKYKNKSRVKSRCNHSLPKNIKKEKKKSMKLKRRETDQDYCIKVLNEVCRLTMVELQGGVWVNNNKSNNIVQEISYEIGQQILQLLVYEIVDELCTSL